MRHNFRHNTLDCGAAKNKIAYKNSGRAQTKVLLPLRHISLEI